MHPQLLSKLSKPSRVASILDWKRHSQSSNTNANTSTQQQQQQQAHTVLALNIHKNRVGIAVASHPSLGMPCLELEPLRFRKRSIAGGAIDANCLERFAAIIEDYKVCGIVVNWPLQHDTGRMGAACGRVVFALEQLVERSNESWRKQQQQQQATNGNGNGIESNNDHSNHHNNSGFLSRPFCLWDAGHIETLQREDPSRMVDSFGRCASYGREPTSPPNNNNNNNNHYRASASAASNNHHEHEQHQQQQQQYFAAKEQYYEDELTVVLGVWDDFCREHWPDLYQSQQLQLQLQSQTQTQSQTELQSQLQEEPIAATTTTASNSNSNNNEAGMIHRRCGQHSGSTPVDAQQQQLSPPLPASSSTSATSATSTATPTPPVSKLRQSMVKQKKSLILMR